jgi:hypothetical protein
MLLRALLLAEVAPAAPVALGLAEIFGGEDLLVATFSIYLCMYLSVSLSIYLSLYANG